MNTKNNFNHIINIIWLIIVVFSICEIYFNKNTENLAPSLIYIVLIPWCVTQILKHAINSIFEIFNK